MAEVQNIDIAQCVDEEVLTNMLSKIDDPNQRKQIRSRLKEIREIEMKQAEERRHQRESQGSLDAVKMRAQMAEEDKARRMKGYDDMSKAGHAGATYDPIKEAKLRKDQAKAAQLKHFDDLAKEGGAAEYQGGLERVKQMEHAHSEAEKERLMQQFSNIQTNYSTQQEKQALAPKAQTGGPRQPRGKNAPKAAMNAFKAMDKETNPGATGTKPNFLTAPGAPAKGTNVQRSPSAIKQMLLDWCKAMTQEYKEQGVTVTNFSGSWADGLAFCALIHHFYPESFDFSKLKGENRRYNFQLAFDTAEKYADISPLLDVEDMVMMKTPDWKCVFTYIQSFYRKLRNHPRSQLQTVSHESEQQGAAGE